MQKLKVFCTVMITFLGAFLFFYGRLLALGTHFAYRRTDGADSIGGADKPTTLYLSSGNERLIKILGGGLFAMGSCLFYLSMKKRKALC
ncbi:hypothetical protein ACR6HW_03245 [Fusibacter sp. JL298sf-3]